MINRICLLLITSFLTACASMPGEVTTLESKVEGTTETSVNPGWLPDSLIKLGAVKDSKMKANEALLIVDTKVDTIQTKDGLVINIDGQKTTFSSIDRLSDFKDGFFRKRFLVTTDYLKKMVDGKSVWVRINGNGQNAVEGEFSKDGMTTARPGFKKFLTAIGKGS